MTNEQIEYEKAQELLGKLESFMQTVNMQIETLINRTNNLRVDIDKLKKHFIKESRIITAN